MFSIFDGVRSWRRSGAMGGGVLELMMLVSWVVSRALSGAFYGYFWCVVQQVTMEEDGEAGGNRRGCAG